MWGHPPATRQEAGPQKHLFIPTKRSSAEKQCNVMCS